MGTIRQNILTLLQQEALNALELSQELKVPEKEIYSHIDHVFRSAQASGLQTKTLPPRCLSCGFVFRVTANARRPGRCPQCKNSHIEAPRFRIE